MSSGPRFSIVIPTRNRAGLLRHALATALAQEHDDFEVVVSDNASDDDTPLVVARSDHPRLRSVRSDTPLSNAESWEFAVSHARGAWVTVLGDDDGFVPSLLSRLERVLDADAPVVVWNPAWYVHPDTEPPWPVAAERNTMSVPPYTGGIAEIDAPEQLARCFRREEHEPIPGFVNAVVHRDAIGRLHRRAGRVFGEPDPNWWASVGLLTCIDRYRVLDLPLTVAGVSPVNIGGAFLRNTREHDVVREFDRSDLFGHVPLQSRSCANLIAESLMRARAALPEALSGFALDPVSYYVTTGLELSDARRQPDGGAALDEWRTALSREPRHLSRQVRRRLLRAKAGQAMVRGARRLPGYRAARNRLGRHRVAGATFRAVVGAEQGFDAIPGAAAWLDATLPADERDVVPEVVSAG